MSPHWKPPDSWRVLTAIDAHTAGEPLRVITGGLPEIPGKTILEKRGYFRENFDYLRTGLIWEPRGHADMYGAILTEPVSEDGDFGVIFFHNEGYSSMCGHGIIALVKITLDTGMIVKEGENPVLKIDTPAGRVTATAHRKAEQVKDVSFQNVPSFVYKSDQEVNVQGIGNIRYDVAFGGAFYAFCKAEDLNLGLETKDYGQLIDFGRRIKHAVIENLEIKHPFEDELSFLYGTIFVNSPVDSNHHSRNVCIFADGEVDRSPTGTGVSARAAIHYFKKEMSIGEQFTVESILGTFFNVRIVRETEFGPFPAVIPEVTGSASLTGSHEFYFDPDDPLQRGFIFR